MNNETIEHTFEEGQLWEDYPWMIIINEETDKKCRHSKNERIKRTQNYQSDSYWEKTVWDNDVVIAFNEGQYNSTGVCLWCILDAVDNLGLKNEQ